MHPDRLSLFRDMLRIRRIEERIADRYAEQEMRCPVHLSVGQEAVAVGVCAALGPDDQVMSGHRAHAHYLAKGGDLKRMIAELYGKADGCTGGIGGSMHLLDLTQNFMGAVPIVSSTIPIVVGLAFGKALQKQAGIAVAFFGDAATEEGVFYESLQFAALKALPVLFICENNLYSVYSPLSVRQSAKRRIVDTVEGHHVYARCADGNAVETVLAETRAAIQAMESDGGPAFLEFSTYRWLEHCGPNYDNHIGYRQEDEFLAWKKKDPIAGMETMLRQSGDLDDVRLATYEDDITAEIDAAFAYAKASPFPKPSAMMSHVEAAA